MDSEMSLVSSLHRYGGVIDYVDEPPQKIKIDNLSQVMNIIAIAVECVDLVHESQIIQLERFKDKFSVSYPQDKVVLLVSEAIDYIRLLNPMPSEIRNSTLMFLDLPVLNFFPQKMKNQISQQAICGILNTQIEGAAIDFDNLSKFTAVALLSIKENLEKAYIQEFANKISLLTKHPECSNVFKGLATATIKSLEGHIIPQEISVHPAFHGKSLSKGFDMLMGALRDFGLQTGSHCTDLSSFVLEYCKKKLLPHQYLLRNSSRALPTVSKFGYTFPITLTYKDAIGHVQNIRLNQWTNNEGQVRWVESFEIDGSIIDKKLSESLVDLLRETEEITGYTPIPAPDDMEIEEYVYKAYERKI